MIVVFAGPTISHTQIKQQLDCVCLGPVSHGDILDVMECPPDAIGIIDGYFEGAPSIWHKEILYAMDQGVSVYGSASMGALRAAELHAFGMQGVGQIFEGYRDGVLEDDDEVAVLHGPAEAGYTVASVPMVNIRATLTSAEDHGIISVCQKDALLELAKNIFYKKRSWNRLLIAANALFGEVSTSQSLEAWLENHKVDQKRNDALQMLAVMNTVQSHDSSQSDKRFKFEWTSVWDEAVREHQQALQAKPSLSAADLTVLGQLQLEPDLYQRYCDKALLNWMCKYPIETHVDDQSVKLALNNFRADQQLNSRSQLTDYMNLADLSESSLTKLLTDNARVGLARQAVGNLEDGIIAQLKLDGQYIRLHALAVSRT